MKSIIKIENNTPVLVKSVQEQLIINEAKIKALQDEQSSLKKAIQEEMEKNNIVKFENDDFIISLVAPTTKEYFNSKKLLSEMADIYDEYVEIRPVKGSIRFKFK